MLVLKKRGVSSTYRLIDSEADRELGVLDCHGEFRDSAATLDGVALAIVAAPGATRSYELSVDGVATATATSAPPSTARRQFVISRDDLTLDMECHSARQKPFDVIDGAGAPLGTVALRGATGRRVEIDLPSSVPFSLQVFAGWLAMCDYNAKARTRTRIQ